MQLNKQGQFCVWRLAIESNLKKYYFFWFYILLALRLFYGYDISGAHTNDSSEDTPEGLQ